MKIVLLSESFYSSYSRYSEILKKKNRPYVCLTIRIDDMVYAIPLRHHIHHQYAFFTVGEAGLDYTKAIPITDPSFISSQTAWIETEEWTVIKGHENKIRSGFRKYLSRYKRAIKHPEIPVNQTIIKYSALQYFCI